MLAAVHFENYRAFKAVSVKLTPLTLIIGPNATGKTSVLRGIQRFASFFSKQFSVNSTDLASIHQNVHAEASRTAAVFSGEISGSGENGQISVSFSPPRGANRGIELQCVVSGATEGRVAPSLTASDPHRITGSLLDDGNSQQRGIIQQVPAAMLLRLEPTRLAQATSTDAPPGEASVDGYGLPAQLVDLAASSSESYRELMTCLRELVPAFRNIRLERLQSGGAREIRFDFAEAKNLSASDVSEGTLIALGLLTYGFTGVRPQVMLIDELERGLHPRALHQLVKHLRRITEIVPGSQIVATTHSPYLVDQFRYEEIRVTSLLQDGSATVASFEECPDLNRWRDEMLPGELWSAVGEKWVVEKRQDVND